MTDDSWIEQIPGAGEAMWDLRHRVRDALIMRGTDEQTGEDTLCIIANLNPPCEADEGGIVEPDSRPTPSTPKVEIPLPLRVILGRLGATANDGPAWNSAWATSLATITVTEAGASLTGYLNYCQQKHQRPDPSRWVRWWSEDVKQRSQNVTTQETQMPPPPDRDDLDGIADQEVGQVSRQ